MVVPRLRILIALLVVALAGTLAAPAASPAKGHHKLPHRDGGKVHKAWPAKHVRGKRAKRPRKALSRFLAKQVGPTKLKVEKPKNDGRPHLLRRPAGHLPPRRHQHQAAPRALVRRPRRRSGGRADDQPLVDLRLRDRRDRADQPEREDPGRAAPRPARRAPAHRRLDRLRLQRRRRLEPAGLQHRRDRLDRRRGRDVPLDLRLQQVRRARGRHHQVAAQPPATRPACSPARRRRPGSRPSTTSSPGT